MSAAETVRARKNHNRKLKREKITPGTHILDHGRDHGDFKGRAEEFISDCVYITNIN